MYLSDMKYGIALAFFLVKGHRVREAGWAFVVFVVASSSRRPRLRLGRLLPQRRVAGAPGRGVAISGTRRRRGDLVAVVGRQVFLTRNISNLGLARRPNKRWGKGLDVLQKYS